eukprot:4443233-Amphidinium_carterae.1
MSDCGRPQGAGWCMKVSRGTSRGGVRMLPRSWWLWLRGGGGIQRRDLESAKSLSLREEGGTF